FEKYGVNHKLNVALLIGGVSMDEQIKKLDRGVDVLIATPGRLMDHFDRGRIILNDVKVLVIDEADRMLDMGFIPDVERIVSMLPKIRQTLFFSATMNADIRRLADQFLMNPKEVQADTPATAATTVVQGLVMVRAEDKRECVRRLIRAEHLENAFIFCNRKRDVDILYKSLVKHGFNAVALHGDMPQSKRMEMLAKFKSGEAKLLVCSDVAARGLDITGVSHVINFDVPIHSEDYVHRIGRTGRAGLTGHAVTIATPADAKFLASIENLLKQPIPQLVEPAVDDIRVDPATVPADDGSDRGSRVRGRGRGRKPAGPGRGRGRGPARDRGPAPVAAPAPMPMPEAPVPEVPMAAAPPPEEQPARHDNEKPRGRGRGRGGRERNDRGPRQDRWQRDAGVMEHGENALGFGAFLPAFMQGPARAQSLSPEAAQMAETMASGSGARDEEEE
ncbi:MAG: DEAD/DEAH box helicase, partial [Rhodospirillaceae bacterium]|nr:DEAD/DEAH box helicase [Rhodospirillaceae bacterium]